jgi:hypothetical protein
MQGFKFFCGIIGGDTGTRAGQLNEAAGSCIHIQSESTLAIGKSSVFCGLRGYSSSIQDAT